MYLLDSKFVFVNIILHNFLLMNGEIDINGPNYKWSALKNLNL